jgi:hypothetical protein
MDFTIIECLQKEFKEQNTPRYRIVFSAPGGTRIPSLLIQSREIFCPFCIWLYKTHPETHQKGEFGMISLNHTVLLQDLNYHITVQMAPLYSGYSLQYLRRLPPNGTLEPNKVGQPS